MRDSDVPMNDFRALLSLYSHGLWRFRWFVLAITWAACAAGWLLVMALPDRYVVGAKVQVDADRLLTPLLREILSQTDPEQNMIRMQADILSKPALAEIARRAGLVERGASDTAEDRAALTLVGRVRVVPADQNNFDVSYEDADPWQAQRIVQATIDTLVERNLAAARQQTEKALRFIDSQIRLYEGRLADAEASLADFQREHGAELSSSENVGRRQQELNSELQQIEADQRAKAWLRDRVRAEIEKTAEWTTEQQIVGPSGLSAQQQHIDTLRQRLNELTQIYTDRHPDVQALRAQIAEADSQAAREARRAARKPSARRSEGDPRLPNPLYQRLQQDQLSVDSQIVALEQRGQAVKQGLENLRGTIENLPDLQRQTTQLNRDYGIIRATYDSMVQRRESIALAQSMAGQKSTLIFFVAEKPKLPEVPAGPNRPLFFLVVALCAVSVGIAAGLARIIFAGPGISTVAALRAISSRPVLGTISLARSRHPLKTVAVFSAFSGAALMLLMALGGLVYTYKFTPFRPNLGTLTQTALLGIHSVF